MITELLDRQKIARWVWNYLMGRKHFDVWETLWWREDYLTGIELFDGYGTK
jgi:hypothetical protein